MTRSWCWRTSRATWSTAWTSWRRRSRERPRLDSRCISMSVSLVAVFIPLLMMGGIVGRLFREFAVTLSIAIAVSLLVSLTTTPTMCAKFLRSAEEDEKHNIFYRTSEWFFDKLLDDLQPMLKWVLSVPAGHAGRHHSGGLPERLPLHHCAEGILPAAGYGTHHGLGDGGAGYLIPVDERQDAALRQHCDERSGGRHHGGICGRGFGAEPGSVLHDAKAAGRSGARARRNTSGSVARRDGRRRDQPSARQIWRWCRAQP